MKLSAADMAAQETGGGVLPIVSTGDGLPGIDGQYAHWASGLRRHDSRVVAITPL